MTYIPRCGDKVKIVGLHNDDSYSSNPDNYIGLVVRIDFDSPVREYRDGCYGFSGLDEDNNGYVFFAAIVEEDNMTTNNLDALPPRVTKDIVDYLTLNMPGFCPDETAARIHMRTMSDGELMNAYLIWNGIIGYTEQIMTAYEAIREATRR